jgi:hypothetical protein
METLTIERTSPVNEYQREDEPADLRLADLWRELARDLIDHARITQEWLGTRSTSDGLSHRNEPASSSAVGQAEGQKERAVGDLP